MRSEIKVKILFVSELNYFLHLQHMKVILTELITGTSFQHCSQFDKES